MTPNEAPADLRQVAGEYGDGLIQVAYLHKHTVSHSWHECMTRHWLWDASRAQRMVRTAGPLMVRCYTGAIAESRNFAAKHFLEQTPHEWLFWVDTDMGFPHDCAYQLLAVADPVARPVVGALCFALRETRGDGMGGRRVAAIPTLYNIGTQDDGLTGFAPMFGYPRDSVVQVAGTGSACILIHRSALEAVREKYGDEWYTSVRYDDGRTVSEDLSFCYRLGSLSIPVFVHTGVKTTHHKEVWIGELDYVEPVNAQEVDGRSAPQGVRVIDEAELEALGADVSRETSGEEVSDVSGSGGDHAESGAA